MNKVFENNINTVKLILSKRFRIFFYLTIFLLTIFLLLTIFYFMIYYIIGYIFTIICLIIMIFTKYLERRIIKLLDQYHNDKQEVIDFLQSINTLVKYNNTIFLIRSFFKNIIPYLNEALYSLYKQ